MPVRVRVYTTHDGEPLSALIAKLEYPVPLLEELGNDLAALLRANVMPHSRSGTLLAGIDDVTLYKKRGSVGDVWAVGIGDPKILTDWNQKAPPGTIAEFLRWIFGENRRLRGKNEVKRKRSGIRRAQEKELRRAAREAQKARGSRKASRLAQRESLAQEYFAALSKFSKTAHPSSADIGNLERLRDLLGARGVSFERLGRISAYLVRRQYRGTKSAPDVIREFSSHIAYFYTRSRAGDRVRYNFEAHAKAFEKYFTGRAPFPGFRFQTPKPMKAPKPIKVPKAAKAPKPIKLPKPPKAQASLKSLRKSVKKLAIKVLKTRIAARFTKIRTAKAASAKIYSPFLRSAAAIAWWKYRLGGKWGGR